MNRQQKEKESFYLKQIITEWLKQNITPAEQNYRVRSKDIYTKFIKDTGLKNVIKVRTFGNLMASCLEELNIKHKKGFQSYFYGIDLKDVKGNFSLIDVINTKDENKFVFNVVNDEKIKIWINDCIIVQKNTTTAASNFVSTRKLFNNYLNYYNITNIENVRGPRILFGTALSKALKTIDINIKHTKQVGNGIAGYINIQELVDKKYKESDQNKLFNSTTNIQKTKIDLFKFAVISFSILNLSVLILLITGKIII